MKRNSFDIPNSLIERLKALPKNLDSSEVLREGLEWILSLKELEQSAGNSTETIARLKWEKRIDDEMWKDLGYRQGLKFAKEEFSYREILGAVEGNEKILKELIEHMLAFKVHEYVNDVRLEKYFDGWIDGVEYVWDSIKHEFQAKKPTVRGRLKIEDY
ncbi:MAG: hypothetical protein F6J92_31175 [Symploca sp. SIO1A3]|nr:hypothetical protein [Symploca sp. SIO1A3]